MRIELYLAYWPWFLARGAGRAGAPGEPRRPRLGMGAEAWGQDVVSVLGHLRAVTERIDLGSGLMQIPARGPAMTAMTAATLDTLSSGRFRLGLGLSGRRSPRAGTGCRSRARDLGRPWLGVYLAGDRAGPPPRSAPS